ncbi:MAG: hypothetical protein RBT51_00550 [Ectothiorhodospiraceae bacterium]|jgi:hypothetical protein|nr:hypothetical protein [Ectothiorhodospiraceae bacterium]
MAKIYKIQNPYCGALAFLLSTKHFIEMSVENDMARNVLIEKQNETSRAMTADQLEAMEQQFIAGHSEVINNIKSVFLSSLFYVLAASSISILIAAILGHVNANFPINKTKILSLLGSSLIAWATLMKLGGNFSTWNGEAFPQIVQTVIFKSIFIPGVSFVLLSILM